MVPPCSRCDAGESARAEDHAAINTRDMMIMYVYDRGTLSALVVGVVLSRCAMAQVGGIKSFVSEVGPLPLPVRTIAVDGIVLFYFGGR